MEIKLAIYSFDISFERQNFDKSFGRVTQENLRMQRGRTES
jgi:hypothetical protein